MKKIIYQILPRLWGHYGPDGGGVPKTLGECGCGKFGSIDEASLAYIKDLGVSYVWYTGVIRHATKASENGCVPSHPQLVKGEAGSPYSITDYYDVNPYLADVPSERMSEFESLIDRTHAAGLKVVMDFIPNHVARDYCRHGSAAPAGTEILGAGDDVLVHWRPENDFFYYPGTVLQLPNRKEFDEECSALRSGDFGRKFNILPQWLVDYAAEGGDTGKYAHLLEPFMEAPAKATGNNYTPQPTANDWYETVKLNYCDFHTGTWDKMLDIVRFWAGKGVDGFRCDMAELVPPEFLTWLIRSIKEEFPDIIFIAEVYQKNEYGKYVREVGFDMLYDKSGLYDSLRAIVGKNVNGSGAPELWQSARQITGSWQFLGNLQSYMLNFLENHDEQRIASPFFAGKAENAYAALAVSLLLNTASFMIYAGQEAGEEGMDDEPFSGVNGRTSIFDWWQVGSLRMLWRHIHGMEKENSVLKRYRELLKFASCEPAVTEGAMFDLCYCNYGSEGFDPDRHFAFLRSSAEKTFLIAANFSGETARMTLNIPPEAIGSRMTVDMTVQPMDWSVRLI